MQDNNSRIKKARLSEVNLNPKETIYDVLLKKKEEKI